MKLFKKAFMCVGLLLLIFSVGCSNNAGSEPSMSSNYISSKYHEKSNDLQETPSEIDSEQVSSINGVAFRTTESKYSKNNSIIEYIIQNNGNKQISFSPYSYALEKKVSDKWQAVSFDKEYEFLLLDRVLEPGEEAVYTIDLRNEFNLPLKKGVYRIVKEELKSEPFKIE